MVGTMSGAADGIGGERLVATDQLCQTFMRVFRMMKRSMTRATPPRPDGVEFAAYVLLAHLVVEGPMRSTALADAVHADPSTVSRQTAALVRHGMLERRADPIDGRASLLAATLDGQRAFDAYRQRNNGIIADVVRDWPVARIYQLASLLGDFAADFENHEYGQCPARPPAVAGPAPKGPRP